MYYYRIELLTPMRIFFFKKVKSQDVVDNVKICELSERMNLLV